MSRTARIDYQRITFSFPKRVVMKLKQNVPSSKRSEYIAELIDEDLSNCVEDVDGFIQSLKDFSENVEYKTDKSSLEILREIRYGKKD